MIQHAFYWLLETELKEPLAGTIGRDLANNLLTLTDDELYHLFYEVCGKYRHRVPWYLVRCTVLGQAFPCYKECSVDDTAIIKVIEAQKRTVAVKGAAPTYSMDWTLQMASALNIDPSAITAILVSQYALTRHPWLLRTIEESVWEKMIANKVIGQALSDILSSKAFPEDVGYGKEVDHIHRALENYPLLFIVPTWEFRMVAKSNAEVSGLPIPILRFFGPPGVDSIRDCITECLNDGTLLYAATSQNVPVVKR